MTRQGDERPAMAPPAATAAWTGLLLLITLIWGNSFIAVKHIVQYVTLLELVTVRFVPVTLIFGLWLLLTRGREVVHLVRAEGGRVVGLFTWCPCSP